MKKMLMILLAAALAFSFAGCNKEGGSGVITGVSLPEVTQVEEGGRLQLVPKITTARALSDEALKKELEKMNFRWVSEDPGMVLVDLEGNIRNFGEGETVVTFTSKDGTLSAQTRVITEVPVTEILAEDIQLTTLDTTAQISYQVLPENAEAAEPMVTVEGDCVTAEGTTLTVQGSGDAVVTLQLEDVVKTINVSVRLAPKELSIADQYLKEGTSKDLFISDGLGDYLEAEVGRTYTFTTSDASVAEVDETGRLMAHASGTAQITVTNELGQSASANVTVS